MDPRDMVDCDVKIESSDSQYSSSSSDEDDRTSSDVFGKDEDSLDLEINPDPLSVTSAVVVASATKRETGPAVVPPGPYSGLLTGGPNPKSQSRDENYIEIIKHQQIKIGHLKRELRHSRARVEELSQINYRLQNHLINKFDSILTSNSRQSEQEKETVDEVGTRKNGFVHLGRGVYLPEPIYDTACRTKSDTIFIKTLAVSVFGANVLAGSSVQGMPSNRTKAPVKPALDATKLMAIHDIYRYHLQSRGYEPVMIEEQMKLINAVISQKIQDLVRGFKRPRTESGGLGHGKRLKRSRPAENMSNHQPSSTVSSSTAPAPPPDLEPRSQDLDKIGTREKGFVYLGRGVYLPEHLYDTACRRQSGQKFVKTVAIYVFGAEVLSQSSVTGTSSNRTKAPAKAALDATKLMAIHDIYRHFLRSKGCPQAEIESQVKKVNTIISQKIQDLNRGPRKIRNSDDGDNTEYVDDNEMQNMGDHIVLSASFIDKHLLESVR